MTKSNAVAKRPATNGKTNLQAELTKHRDAYLKAENRSQFFGYDEKTGEYTLTGPLLDYMKTVSKIAKKPLGVVFEKIVLSSLAEMEKQRAGKNGDCPLPPFDEFEVDYVFEVTLGRIKPGTVISRASDAIAFDESGKLWLWKDDEWQPITLAESAEWFAETERATRKLGTDCVQMGPQLSQWFEAVAKNLEVAA